VDPGAVVVLILGVLVVVALATALAWDRYHPRVRAEHPLPTTEVFIDPVTHRRMRVWVDPLSGAREYREELETTARALPPLDRPGLVLPPDPDADAQRRLPPPPHG
jgi:hypothetical protein